MEKVLNAKQVRKQLCESIALAIHREKNFELASLDVLNKRIKFMAGVVHQVLKSDKFSEWKWAYMFSKDDPYNPRNPRSGYDVMCAKYIRNKVVNYWVLYQIEHICSNALKKYAGDNWKHMKVSEEDSYYIVDVIYNVFESILEINDTRAYHFIIQYCETHDEIKFDDCNGKKNY